VPRRPRRLIAQREQHDAEPNFVAHVDIETRLASVAATAASCHPLNSSGAFI
jgi:hypothetical protein